MSFLDSRTRAAREGIGKPVMLSVKLQPLEAAFRSVTREKVGALLVFRERIFVEHRQRIVDFAATNRPPAMYSFREPVEAGGLMSYTRLLPDLFRRVAGYVDKILKGAKPADLPVEQPMEFELVINLKTAKALGLTITPSLLVRANQVIE